MKKEKEGERERERTNGKTPKKILKEIEPTRQQLTSQKRQTDRPKERQGHEHQDFFMSVF